MQSTSLETYRYRLATQLLHKWGDTSTSYLTLNPANRIFIEQGGEAYLAYRLKFGIALSVGDPVGSPKGRARCLVQFVEQCRRRNISPVFFLVEKHLPLYYKFGLKSMLVAEDLSLDLNKLHFKGREWQDIRTSFNRAGREQVEFHRYEPGTNPAGLIEQFHSISREWVRQKNLPELGFTLGSAETVASPAIRTYYGRDSRGQVQGFVSWLPVYASKGWTLDLMRRKKGAMPGLMEFLIAKSACALQAEGCSHLSLGASPLPEVARRDRSSSGDWVLAFIKSYLQDYYNFDGLYAFKRKFQPEKKPLYLFYPGWSSVIRGGLGLVSLYLS